METATRPAPDTGGVPLYEARDIVKRYGHVEALRGASFAAYAGEVTALIGDNGAGKSTLVKILSGAERPDSGSLLLDGKPIALSSPQDAHRHGIETVYQDLSLATDMDPAANIFMGREILRRGLLGKLLGRVPLPGATAEYSGLRLTGGTSRGRGRGLATVFVEATDRLRAVDAAWGDERRTEREEAGR